jgi:sugar phosphate permease
LTLGVCEEQHTRESPLTATRYHVLGFLCAAAVIAYVQRMGLNVAEEAIREDLALDKEQLGMVMSAWYFGYAALQLPSGWLADRFGSRVVLAALALCWSAWTALTALAWDHHSLLVFWLCMGLAQAGIFPCSAKSIGQWFDDSRRASASGLLASAMALGGAIAPALTGVLLTYYTWQEVFTGYAAVGIIWAASYLMLIPEAPDATLLLPDEPARRVALPQVVRWQPGDWLTLVTSVPMILLCSQQFFRACGMAFFYTWFPTFLRETRGVDLKESGYMTGVVGLGAMLGGILGGFVSDWLLVRTGNRRLSRQGIAVVGLSICCVLVLASNEIDDTKVAIGMIALGTFAATFGGISGYTVAIDFGGRRVATIFSIMNMCGNIGAAIFPFIVGKLLTGPAGTPGSASDWDVVIYLFAGILAIDAIIWALLNPKGTLFRDEPTGRRSTASKLAR